MSLVSAVATVLSWRDSPWRLARTGASSWQEGLALGFNHHLQWGPGLVFTFGPWGFLEDVLPFYRLTAGLALLYALAVTWGLAALVILALRRSWGLLPAGVVAWVVVTIAANMIEVPSLALATALGLALASLRPDSERARLWLLGLLGALSGLQFLVEITVGLVTLGLLAVAVAFAIASTRGLITAPGATGRTPVPALEEAQASTSTATSVRASLTAAVTGARPPRSMLAVALAAGAPLIAVFLAAWVAAGQSLSNLASYLRGSFSVVVGYSSAMSSSSGRRAEDWSALVVGLLAVLLYGLATRGRPFWEKAAIFLMLAGWGWEVAKEGFVRHDMHDLTFFGLVLVALCLARLSRMLVPLQVAAIVTAALVACVAGGGAPASLSSPRQDVGALVQEVRDLVLPGHWATVEAKARKQVLGHGDALPPWLVTALTGRTVAAEPYEDSITFAYPQLRWDPEPVLQAYSAYTGYLDHLDASFLSSARAPGAHPVRPG